jgi:hypothetical protein
MLIADPTVSVLSIASTSGTSRLDWIVTLAAGSRLGQGYLMPLVFREPRSATSLAFPCPLMLPRR